MRHPNELKKKSTETPICEKNQIALLVLLCSQDNSIWTTAARCLGALCTEAELLAEIDYVHPVVNKLIFPSGN